MSVRRNSRSFALFAMIAALFAVPALAQFSDSYNFLKAVRDRDGAKVTEFLNGQASTIVNTRDYTSGESALHIVVKRRDDLWIRFLLAKGANPDIRDSAGNTPLIAAAQLGFPEGTAALIEGKANVNTTNSSGETALIVAVQRRDLVNVRLLLSAGANPKIADHIAGMTARDYAERDARASTILKLIDDAGKAKPAAKAQVSGPGL
jgi:ankyrin repeat protein